MTGITPVAFTCRAARELFVLMHDKQAVGVTQLRTACVHAGTAEAAFTSQSGTLHQSVRTTSHMQQGRE